jgi:hypothetical protein
VIRSADTVRCKIYIPKHKVTDDLFLYIIARLPNDSDYVFSPKDISGYTVNGMTMRAHRSTVSGDTNYFFIKLVEKGNITLYERAGVPSDKEYLYYFERAGDSYLRFLAPYKQTDYYITEGYYGSGGGGGSESPMLSKYSAIDEVHIKAALSEYLKDCEAVRNKLSNNFYTIYDVETIIRDYNKCGK